MGWIGMGKGWSVVSSRAFQGNSIQLPRAVWICRHGSARMRSEMIRSFFIPAKAGLTFLRSSATRAVCSLQEFTQASRSCRRECPL